MRDWLFRESSYKKALAQLIREADGARGTISRIAAAIGCQRSYLSQVLHAKAQLTKDQAWNLCQYFGLSALESAFFECLVDHERASSAAFRRHLEKRMVELRRESVKLANQFPRGKSFSESESLSYFSHWLPCAVHLLTSVPDCQEAPAMAQKLGVSLTKVLRELAFLENHGLVRKNRNRWEFQSAPGYMPGESKYVLLHHQNWRQRALENAREPGGGQHYTMVQSLSRADFEKIQAMVVEFVAATKRVAEPSPPELLTALTLDFFEPRA